MFFVSRFSAVVLSVSTILSVASVGHAADIQDEWIAPGISDWNNPANWSQGVVPGDTAADKFFVTIPPPTNSDYSVIVIGENIEVSGLTLAANRLALGNKTPSLEFHVRQDFRWTGGTLAEGAFFLHGNSIFEGESYKYLEGGLVLDGNARWTGGNLDWAGYGRVDINPSAVFQIEAHGYIGSAGTTSSAEIFNNGTLRILASGKTAQIYAPLHNEGLIDVQNGVLQALWTYDGQGEIHIAPEGKLLLSGPGRLTGPPISNEGELIFNGREQEVITDTLLPGRTRIAAEFRGPGMVTFENAELEGGAMSGDGVTRIPSGGSLRVKSVAWFSRLLLNEGLVTLESGARLPSHNSLRHTNAPNGIIRFASSVVFGDPNNVGCYLINNGSLIKDDDSGTAVLAAVFQNQGLVRVSRGKLVISDHSNSFLEPSTASGIFEAQESGTIEANGIEMSSSARLEGNGNIVLNRGSFGGTISSNLSLSLNRVGISTGGSIAVRALQVSGNTFFAAGTIVDISERLAVNGPFNAARLRSHGSSELSFGSLSVSEGSGLELMGRSIWFAGSVQVDGVNSLVSNSGDMRLLGNTELQLRNGATFVNRGRWDANKNIQGMQAIVNSASARLLTVTSLPMEFPEEGLFHINGSVQISTLGIFAEPGAELVFSDLAVTNALIQINGANLSVSNSLNTQDALLSLASARIILPATGWSGSCTLSGSGTIDGSMLLTGLELKPAIGTNELRLNGDLELNGTNSAFLVRLPSTASSNSLEKFLVQGRVILRGRFDLNTALATNHFVPSTNPVVVLESNQLLSGGFENAPSGALMATQDGLLRYRLFYGETSPHGANKLVISHVGSAFDQWRLARFSPDQLQDAAVSGPSADPDHNGFSNIADFVFATDPSNNGSDLPFLQPYSEGYTLISVRKRKDTAGLTARIAVSEDLVNWSESVLGSDSPTLPLHRIFDLDAAFLYVYRYPQPAPHLFLRILVANE